jgi:hypothetical protein
VHQLQLHHLIVEVELVGQVQHLQLMQHLQVEQAEVEAVLVQSHVWVVQQVMVGELVYQVLLVK